MARPKRETSNSPDGNVLETLEEWTDYLKVHAPSFRDFDPDPSP